MRRIAPLGLRTRLIAAFLLVAAISAVSTAALTYRQARTAILTQSQDTAVATLRDQLEGGGMTLPVDRNFLQAQVTELGKRGKPHAWTVYGEYGSLRVTSNTGGSVTSPLISEKLREQIKVNPHAAFQRVESSAGRAYLVVGVPAVFDRQGFAQPTGAVFYAVMPLVTEEETVALMVDAARTGALPGLAIALVPALLAARSVLRPVRDLRTAAQRMGRGRLDTRIEVRGPTSWPGSPRPSTRPPAPWSVPSRTSSRPRRAPAGSPPTSRTSCAPRSPGCSPSPRSSTRTPSASTPTPRRHCG